MPKINLRCNDMARKRMLDNSFWDDPQLGQLPDSVRLLWLALMSNADDEGRGEADISLLRKIAWGCQENPPSFSDAENMLLSLDQTLRSLELYEVDGRRYYFLKNFRYGKKYQTINRPSPSKIPPSPGTDPVPVSSRPNVFVVYEQEIGPLTNSISEKLKLAEQDYTEAWCIEAMKEASSHNARSWAYVEKILQNWKAHGRQSKKPGEKKGNQPKPEGYSKDEVAAAMKKSKTRKE